MTDHPDDRRRPGSARAGRDDRGHRGHRRTQDHRDPAHRHRGHRDREHRHQRRDRHDRERRSEPERHRGRAHRRDRGHHSGLPGRWGHRDRGWHRRCWGCERSSPGWDAACRDGRHPRGAADGSSSSSLSRGTGAGRRPMPWLDANGLLPGRGVPGRAAGRGVGGAGVDASPAGASGSAGGSGSSTTGASGSAGTSATGPGFGAAEASDSTTVAPFDSAVAGAAAFLAAGFSVGASTDVGLGLGGQQRVAVGLLELHLDGKLDRRGSRLDELAHLLQLVENLFALDAVGLGELVYSGLGHCSPSGPRPASLCEGWISDRWWVLQTHREVLIECS